MKKEKAKKVKAIRELKSLPGKYVIMTIYGLTRKAIYNPAGEINNTYDTKKEAEDWLKENGYVGEFMIVKDVQHVKLESVYSNEVPVKDYALFCTHWDQPKVFFFCGVTKAQDSNIAKRNVMAGGNDDRYHRHRFYAYAIDKENRCISTRSLSAYRAMANGKTVVPLSDSLFDNVKDVTIKPLVEDYKPEEIIVNENLESPVGISTKPSAELIEKMKAMEKQIGC